MKTIVVNQGNRPSINQSTAETVRVRSPGRPSCWAQDDRGRPLGLFQPGAGARPPLELMAILGAFFSWEGSLKKLLALHDCSYMKAMTYVVLVFGFVMVPLQKWPSFLRFPNEIALCKMKMALPSKRLNSRPVMYNDMRGYDLCCPLVLALDPLQKFPIEN